MSLHDEPSLVRPSLLDRLIDDDPGVEVETPRSPRQQLRDLQSSIRRDLDNLLNSRHCCISTPEALVELKSSLLNYGLPDLNAVRLGLEDDREQLLRRIHEAIKRHEPRFKSLKVEEVSMTARDRDLRFHIDAEVHADPAPERVVFDSAIEPVARTVEVKARK